METGIFHSDQQHWMPGGADVGFDRVKISEIITGLFREETNWRSFLKNNNVNHLEIYYEDLVTDYVATSSRILGFLELQDHPVPTMPTARMNYSRTSQLKREYMKSLGIKER
jgi:LPS sulfotransferase NodH